MEPAVAQDEEVERYYRAKQRLSEQKNALFWRIEEMPIAQLASLAADIDKDIASSAIIAMGRREVTDQNSETIYKALAEAMEDPRTPVRLEDESFVKRSS